MLWWISFFNYADRQAIFSIFPLLEKEMHLTPVQLGLLGSSFAWVYGLAAPLAGRIVDRVRRKSAILGGLFAWSAICMTTALTRNFRALFLVRSAQGLGETFYFPAAMSMISDYHGPRTRSRAMSLHQTSVYIGTIAGSFFAARIAQSYGWKSSFIVFGGLGILLGLALQRWLSEPERGADEHAESSLGGTPRKVQQVPLRELARDVWRTPTAVILMAAFLCANFVATVLLSWMPKFLYDKFHFGLAMAGLSATLFAQLASMVGSPLGGWLADALRRVLPGGRILVQGGSVLLGAPFVLLCAQTRSVKWLFVGLTAWGLFKGLYDANIFASLYDFIRPEARGTAAGMMNMAGWLGGGTAPLLVGYVAERSSLTQALSLTALVYVGGGALLLTAMLVFVNRDTARLRAHA